MSWMKNAVATGLVAATTSALAAMAAAKARGARVDQPMNALSHIVWGGRPPGDAGRKRVNTVTGLGLHVGSAVLWGSMFEALFGRAARSSTAAAVVGAASVSTTAFIVDYYIVDERFQPGLERFVSDRGLFAFYAALAAGFVIAARSRPLRRQRQEDGYENGARGQLEERPDAEVAPQAVRQRAAMTARFTG